MAVLTDHVPSASASERLRILNENKTIAMVGLSADPMRPSHFAAIYMQSEGYEIIPVNPALRRAEDPRRDGLCLAERHSRSRSISSMSSASRRSARPRA